MSNFSDYAGAVKTFSTEFGKINSEFYERAEKIKKYAGSRGYQQDLNQLEQDRQAKIAELKKQTAERLNTALAGMRSYVANLKMIPPSADTVNILQVLSMRERLTESDIVTAYEAVKESGVAVGMLQELARKHGIVVSLRSDIDRTTAERIVETLTRSARNFIAEKGFVANYRIASTLEENEIMARMSCLPLKAYEESGITQTRYDTEAAEALSKMVG